MQEDHSLLLIPILGKKARTFDLEAMFEQTRRTAVERSRKTLEAREKEEEMNREYARER